MVENTPTTFDNLASVKALKEHYEKTTSKKSLRDLLNDESRNAKLRMTYESFYTHKELNSDNAVYFDYSHTHIDTEGLDLLNKVYDETKVMDKFKSMF
jgi:hypothetical protein